MKLFIVLIVLLSGPAQALISSSIGSKIADNDSRHLGTIHIISLETTLYKLYRTDWVLKFDPQVIATENADQYDFTVPEASISRRLEDRESRLSIGKENTWVMGEMISIVGGFYESYYNDYRRSIKTQVGMFTKSDKRLDRQIGQGLIVTYTDQKTIKKSIISISNMLLRDRDKDNLYGFDASILTTVKKIHMGANFKSFGYNNIGYNAHVGMGNTLIRLRQDLDKRLSNEGIDNQIMRTFGLRNTLWVDLSANFVKNIVQFGLNYNLDKSGAYQVLLSSQTGLWNISPYMEYLNIDDMNQLLGGLVFQIFQDHEKSLKFNAGMGRMDIKRRVDYDYIYFVEGEAKVNITLSDQIVTKMRAQKNYWIENDFSVAAFYNHIFGH